MTVWWLTLILTFLLCAVAQGRASNTAVGNKEQGTPHKLFSFLACFLLVLVSGLRSGIGDTKTYIASFEALPNTFEEYFRTMQFKGDWGYDFICMLIKTLFGNNAQVMIFIMAAITISLIFITLYKYSGMLEMGVFLFIATGCYLVSMNGIRQYLVSAILFAAFPLIDKKKWYYYLPLVLIVSQIHQSALIFLPLYFVVNCKAWGKMTKALLLGGVLLYVTYPVSGPIIASLLGETQYGIYSDMLVSSGNGANIIRVFVMAVPVLFSYIGRKRIAGREKYFNIVVNMSVLNLVFILLASKFWVYARFNMYFTLYMLILTCWCFKYVFKKKENKLVYCLGLVLFGIYYWYEMAVSLGQVYMSNFIRI